jgi:dihydrodipicolinate reductase
MGQRVVALTIADPELKLVAALESATSPMTGRDAGELAGAGNTGVKISSELTTSVDVIIDFSTPEGLSSVVTLCEGRRIPLIVATTGLSPEQRRSVEVAAQTTSIVMAPSMSMAVNLAMLPAEQPSILEKLSPNRWGSRNTCMVEKDAPVSVHRERLAIMHSAPETMLVNIPSSSE